MAELKAGFIIPGKLYVINPVKLLITVTVEMILSESLVSVPAYTLSTTSIVFSPQTIIKFN